MTEDQLYPNLFLRDQVEAWRKEFEPQPPPEPDAHATAPRQTSKASPIGQTSPYSLNYVHGCVQFALQCLQLDAAPFVSEQTFFAVLGAVDIIARCQVPLLQEDALSVLEECFFACGPLSGLQRFGPSAAERVRDLTSEILTKAYQGKSGGFAIDFGAFVVALRLGIQLRFFMGEYDAISNLISDGLAYADTPEVRDASLGTLTRCIRFVHVFTPSDSRSRSHFYTDSRGIAVKVDPPDTRTYQNWMRLAINHWHGAPRRAVDLSCILSKKLRHNCVVGQIADAFVTSPKASALMPGISRLLADCLHHADPHDVVQVVDSFPWEIFLQRFCPIMKLEFKKSIFATIHKNSSPGSNVWTTRDATLSSSSSSRVSPASTSRSLVGFESAAIACDGTLGLAEDIEEHLSDLRDLVPLMYIMPKRVVQCVEPSLSADSGRAHDSECSPAICSQCNLKLAILSTKMHNIVTRALLHDSAQVRDAVREELTNLTNAPSHISHSKLVLRFARVVSSQCVSKYWDDIRMQEAATLSKNPGEAYCADASLLNEVHKRLALPKPRIWNMPKIREGGQSSSRSSDFKEGIELNQPPTPVAAWFTDHDILSPEMPKSGPWQDFAYDGKFL